jgi:hypothetical protein
MSVLLLAGTVATAAATAVAGVIGIGHPGQPTTAPTHKPATSITQPAAMPHGDTHSLMSPSNEGDGTMMGGVMTRMMGKNAMTGMPMSASDMGAMMGGGAMTHMMGKNAMMGMPMMGPASGS